MLPKFTEPIVHFPPQEPKSRPNEREGLRNRQLSKERVKVSAKPKPQFSQDDLMPPI
jgi:hypothetical protein